MRLDWKAASVMGVVGLMMVAGFGAIVVAAADGDLSAQGDALAEVSDAAQYNMTLQVGANVEGLTIPINGADVTVWSVEITQTNDTVTIVLTKVASGTTDSDGNVTFSLPEGDYIVVANYSGLQSILSITLDQDLSCGVLLHNQQAMCPGGDGQMQGQRPMRPGHDRQGPPMMVNATA